MARDGFYFVVPSLALSLLAFYMFSTGFEMIFIYLGTVFFAAACSFVLFFRDPERNVPEGRGLIVSPADGRIVALTESEGARQISIFLSLLDVHINRVPATGEIVRVNFVPGKFGAAFTKEASRENERYEIEIKSQTANITVHQIAGVLARRVVCRLKEGQTVKAGQRFGLIRFGSRIDLYLPGSVLVDVRLGQKVRGGSTVIGRFA